jgi:hypothetical protein
VKRATDLLLWGQTELMKITTDAIILCAIRRGFVQKIVLAVFKDRGDKA